MSILQEICEHLIAGDDERVGELTQQAIADKLPAGQILNDALIAGMDVVGHKFKTHEIYLPDVLLAARAMYAGLEHLRPLLARDGVPSQGKVVLGSVQGDLHDIGKNLVAILLKGAGFEVIDLGNDVPPEQFVTAAVEHDARVIGLSALLTTTMPVMQQVVELVRARGLAGQIKVIIGGAPVSRQYADEIGATAYGFDAANAVDRVKELMAATRPLNEN